MSYACGTLACPDPTQHKHTAIGNKAAASSNGKQHTLPAKCHHPHVKWEAIETIWDPGKQTKQPSRIWGTASATKFGGEQRPECEAHTWSSGEMWNIDSNIRKWGDHEIRRNGSCSSHDVHRHDQIQRAVLQPQPGAKKQMAPRLCLSGVVSPDACFLEAWGFDLGLRDRQSNPVPLFKPVGKAEQFRAHRSYNRDVPRMVDYARSLKKSASSPGLSDTVMTLRPEDVGGEAGEHGGEEANDHATAGKTHGSRSCRYWDAYDHCAKREAAKLSCAIHSPAFRDHKEGYPFVDEVELHPQAIYTRKFRQMGEKGLRGHEGNSRRTGLS